MTMTPQIEGREPRPGNPVLGAALVVYATLLLLWVAIPGSVVAWVQGFDASPLQRGALVVAQAVESASDRIGLSAPYLRARAWFLHRVRGED